MQRYIHTRTCMQRPQEWGAYATEAAFVLGLHKVRMTMKDPGAVTGRTEEKI